MGVILPLVPPEELLAEYIQVAMQDAVFMICVEDGSYYGEIFGFDGLWANADTLEECRQELAEVLEGWIVLSIERGHPIPVLPSIDLMPKEETA